MRRALAQVKPLPKAARQIKSPSFTRFFSQASQSAIGTEAAVCARSCLLFFPPDEEVVGISGRRSVAMSRLAPRKDLAMEDISPGAVSQGRAPIPWCVARPPRNPVHKRTHEAGQLPALASENDATQIPLSIPRYVPGHRGAGAIFRRSQIPWEVGQ